MGAAPPSPRRSQPRLLCPRVSGRTRGFIIFQRVGSCRTVAPGSASSSLRALVWVPPPPLACLPRQARPGLGWTKQERVPCCRGRGRQALHEELRVCRPKSSPRTEAGMGGVWGSGVVSGVPREGLPEERWFVKVLRRRAAGWGVAQLRRPVQRPRGATLTPCPGAASWKQLLPGGTHRTGTFPAGSGVGECRGWLEAAAFDAGVSGEHSAW